MNLHTEDDLCFINHYSIWLELRFEPKQYGSRFEAREPINDIQNKYHEAKRGQLLCLVRIKSFQLK
jgi:hypothetical protein